MKVALSALQTVLQILKKVIFVSYKTEKVSVKSTNSIRPSSKEPASDSKESNLEQQPESPMANTSLLEQLMKNPL